MRDLEIRGAGNLLGSQQSGHMASVGYGLYCKMIEETVARLRGEVDEAAVDPVLDVKVDAYLPDGYVPDSSDRLELYRRIAQVRSGEEREDVLDELIDRFGEPPAPVLRLLDVAQLRSSCMHAGIDSIRQDGFTCFIRFIPAAPITAAAAMTIITKITAVFFIGIHTSFPIYTPTRVRFLLFPASTAHPLFSHAAF